MVSLYDIEMLCRKIAANFDVEKIILFGSYANGTATNNSDIDLLIVADVDMPPVERYCAVRNVLAGFPSAFDLIVKTPDEYEKWRRVVNHIVYFAEKYGKTIYERNN
ncbi:MAG: nucleotidyltransferase domain-containing protein [Sedimentisphaerales bacterium]|nr:nucleotidyltransferase domain-containing protein [Sedimentisphaerales bacterium]